MELRRQRHVPRSGLSFCVNRRILFAAARELQMHNDLFKHLKVRSEEDWEQQNLEEAADAFELLCGQDAEGSSSGESGSEDELEEAGEAEAVRDDAVDNPQPDTLLSAPPALDPQEVEQMAERQKLILAPAEKNRPLSMMLDPHVEELAFPKHFPTAKNAFSAKRRQRISLSHYFKVLFLNSTSVFPCSDTSNCSEPPAARRPPMA